MTKLSPREKATLDCLDQGLSNKEIAVHLKVADATAKVYVKSVMAKLDVHKRSDAMEAYRRLT